MYSTLAVLIDFLFSIIFYFKLFFQSDFKQIKKNVDVIVVNLVSRHIGGWHHAPHRGSFLIVPIMRLNKSLFCAGSVDTVLWVAFSVILFFLSQRPNVCVSTGRYRMTECFHAIVPLCLVEALQYETLSDWL